MAGKVLDGANVAPINYLISSRSNNTTVSYECLELWLVQLYNLVLYEPNLLDQFKRDLKAKFSANLEEISALVEHGEFENTDIDITGKPIRFPKLRFEINVDTKYGEKIPCEMRIRIIPCEKEACINDVVDPKIFSEDGLEILLDKLNSHGFLNITLKKIKDNAWSFVDKKTEFLVLVRGDNLQVFNRDLSPFSSKIVIIVKPIGEWSFSEEEKQQFFQLAEKETKEVVEKIGELYVPKQFNPESLPKAIIRAAATNNERLLDLVDKNRRDSLSFSTKKDGYVNDVMDGVISTLCGIRVKNWMARKWSAEVERCINQTTWKLLESEDTKGLYGTTRNNDVTAISAIFFLGEEKNRSVYKIIRAWVEDLIRQL
jgi:hypothetical protein